MREQSQFVARVGAKRVVRHQLIGDGFRDLRVEAAANVYRGQLLTFVVRFCGEAPPLEFQFGLFGIGLRTDRHILTGRHRQRAGDQAGKAGQDNGMAISLRGCDADDQAGRGNNAVVRAEHGSPQPTNAMSTVAFTRHNSNPSQRSGNVSQA